MIIDVLERTGNRLLRFDPDTARKLSHMQGRVFKLEIQIVDKALFLIPGEGGLQIREEWQGDVDICLKGSPLAFLQFGLRQKNADNRMFIDKKLVIEGDVELAQDFQRMLSELDLDLEELTSHYVGDVAAHQIGRGLRRFRQWAGEAADSLRLDAREYIVEEIRVLAPDWRVAAFIDRTDVLRADVERLEQRVTRLGAQVQQ